MFIKVIFHLSLLSSIRSEVRRKSESSFLFCMVLFLLFSEERSAREEHK